MLVLSSFQNKHILLFYLCFSCIKRIMIQWITWDNSRTTIIELSTPMRGATFNMEHNMRKEFHAARDSSNPYETCNLCHNVLNKPVMKTCGHMFCIECLHMWQQQMQRSNIICECPTCDTQINPFIQDCSSPGDCDTVSSSGDFKCYICFNKIDVPVSSKCGHILCWWCFHSQLLDGHFGIRVRQQCPICQMYSDNKPLYIVT